MSDNKNYWNEPFDEEEPLDVTRRDDKKEQAAENITDSSADSAEASDFFAAPEAPKPVPETGEKLPAAQPREWRIGRKKREKQELAKREDEDEELEDEEEELEMRDYHPIRFRRYGKTGCLGGLMYFTFVVCISVILACCAWLAASDVLSLNKDEFTATITVDINYDTMEVEDEETGEVRTVRIIADDEMESLITQLKDAGLIKYKFLFRLYTQLSKANQKIAPGTYVLSTKYDYHAIVSNMSVGSEAMVETTITFPEGFTMQQIFERLVANNICSMEDLQEAAANYNYNYAFLVGVERGDASSLEGFLFPDTYNFYQGMQASSAINKFLVTFHYKMTAEMYDKAEAKGLTMQQIVTIASMIEKEAANDDERALIASVIYNRLNSGMPLGVDATSLYSHPEHEGAPTEAMLNDSSDPYNPRVNVGLPPTPICSPGIASIYAALDPESTSYYYYALDAETGTHRFFTNCYDFEAFVATQNY